MYLFSPVYVCIRVRPLVYLFSPVYVCIRVRPLVYLFSPVYVCIRVRPLVYLYCSYTTIFPVYNSSAPIQDVALKTYRERWMIETGGGRGSERSGLAACHDHDDMCVSVCKRKYVLIFGLQNFFISSYSFLIRKA